MNYPFSKLKADQLLLRSGTRLNCFMFIVNIGRYISCIKIWGNVDAKKFEFETITRDSWNNYGSQAFNTKLDKNLYKKEINIIKKRIIESVFSYNENIIKYNNNWGN